MRFIHLLMILFLTTVSGQTDPVVFLRSFGNGGVSSYAYTPDWKQLLVGTRDGKVRLYVMSTVDTVLTYHGKWRNPHIIRSPSGKLVAVIPFDSIDSVSIFEMQNREAYR